MIFCIAKLGHARGDAIGRHRATVSSFPRSAPRCFTSASAQGCMGRLGAMLMACEGMPVCASMHPRRAFVSSHGIRSASHNPERSGFPSAIAGAGASRFGVPAAVSGTFVRTSCHCADNGAAAQPTMTMRTTICPSGYIRAFFPRGCLRRYVPGNKVSMVINAREL